MRGQKCSENTHQSGNTEVAVVMVPFPAQGHLNQLLHLSHTIASYGIPVHYAGSGTHNHQAKLRFHGWDSQISTRIHFHDFQLPDYTNLPVPKPDPYVHFPVQCGPLFKAVPHLREPVSQLLHDLSTKFRRIVVVHDSLVTSVVQDVKCIANAESYVFMPISAFAMFLSMWENIDEKPFELPADFPKHIPSFEGSITQEILKYIEEQYKFYGCESGWLCSTSRVVEGTYVELLEKLSSNQDIKHFAIGPMNPVKLQTITRKSEHKCLQWLDKQGKSSVIYIAFGTTPLMTDDQVRELALGLESSEQKFIWVIKTPDEHDCLAEGERRTPKLPEGFEDRVKGRGMVVTDWAPQLKILAHPSTGGFMSHCGWNSSMESISMGVPIAAWPMHSDQPRNTILLTEILKIATVARDWEHRDELAKSSSIENTVRRLMASEEGEEMRKRAAQLSDAIRGSVSDLDSFIAHFTR